MEPALRSFLDGIDENDNVVVLPTNRAPKNDNEEPLQDGSGMLDMRELARRYREMVDGAAPPQSEALPKVSLSAFPNHILAPVIEEPKQRHPALLIASITMGALVLVGLTVVITVIMLRGSGDSAQAPNLLATASEQALVAETPVVDREMSPEAQELPETPELPEMVFEVEEELESAPLPQVARAPAPAPVALAPLAKKSISSEPAQSTQAISKPKIAAAAALPALVTSTEAIAPAVVSSKAIVEPTNTEATDNDTTSCDEVACLLEGRACCAGAAKSASVKAPIVDESRPEKLTRSDISEGLAPVQGRLQSCGTKNAVTGAVTIKFQINAEGVVRRSTVTSGNEAFQSCVSQILDKAQFAQTQAGTTLSYPIILR